MVQNVWQALLVVAARSAHRQEALTFIEALGATVVFKCPKLELGSRAFLGFADEGGSDSDASVPFIQIERGDEAIADRARKPAISPRQSATMTGPFAKTLSR